MPLTSSITPIHVYLHVSVIVYATTDFWDMLIGERPFELYWFYHLLQITGKTHIEHYSHVTLMWGSWAFVDFSWSWEYACTLLDVYRKIKFHHYIIHCVCVCIWMRVGKSDVHISKALVLYNFIPPNVVIRMVMILNDAIQ